MDGIIGDLKTKIKTPHKFKRYKRAIALQKAVHFGQTVDVLMCHHWLKLKLKFQLTK